VFAQGEVTVIVTVTTLAAPGVEEDEPIARAGVERTDEVDDGEAMVWLDMVEE